MYKFTGFTESANNALNLSVTAYTWCASTNNKIDVTDYNVIKFKVKSIGYNSSYSNANIKLICGPIKFAEFNYDTMFTITKDMDINKIFMLDISNLTGLKYIYFGGYYANISIESIWLE